jgi:hypothetical protein
VDTSTDDDFHLIVPALERLMEEITATIGFIKEYKAEAAKGNPDGATLLES